MTSSAAAIPSPMMPPTPAPAAAAPSRSLADRAVSGVLGFANRVRAGTSYVGEKAASIVASRVDSAVARATRDHFAERRGQLDAQMVQLQTGTGVRADAQKVLAGGQTAGTLLRGSTIAAYAIGGGALPALATYGMRAVASASKIALNATSEQTRALSKDAQRAQFEAAVTAPSAGWRTKAGSMLRTVERKLGAFTEHVEQSKRRGEKVSALREVASLLAARQREEIWLAAEGGRLKGSATVAVAASAVTGTLSTLTSLVMGGRSVEHLIEHREQLLHAAERVVDSTRSGLGSVLHGVHEVIEPSAYGQEPSATDPKFVTRPGIAAIAVATPTSAAAVAPSPFSATARGSGIISPADAKMDAFKSPRMLPQGSASDPRFHAPSRTTLPASTLPLASGHGAAVLPPAQAQLPFTPSHQGSPGVVRAAELGTSPATNHGGARPGTPGFTQSAHGSARASVAGFDQHAHGGASQHATNAAFGQPTHGGTSHRNVHAAFGQPAHGGTSHRNLDASFGQPAHGGTSHKNLDATFGQPAHGGTSHRNLDASFGQPAHGGTSHKNLDAAFGQPAHGGTSHRNLDASFGQPAHGGTSHKNLDHFFTQRSHGGVAAPTAAGSSTALPGPAQVLPEAPSHGVVPTGRVLAEGNVHPGAVRFSRGSGLSVDAQQDSISEVARRVASEHQLLHTRSSFHEALRHGTFNGRPANLWQQNLVHDGDTVRIVEGADGCVHVEVTSSHAAATTSAIPDAGSAQVTELQHARTIGTAPSATTPGGALDGGSHVQVTELTQAVTVSAGTAPIPDAGDAGLTELHASGGMIDATTQSAPAATAGAETACYGSPNGLTAMEITERDGQLLSSRTTVQVHPRLNLTVDNTRGTGSLELFNGAELLAPRSEFRLGDAIPPMRAGLGGGSALSLVDGHYIAVDALGQPLPRIDCATVALPDAAPVAAPFAAPIAAPVAAAPIEAAAPVLASTDTFTSYPAALSAPRSWELIAERGVTRDDIARTWDVVRRSPDTVIQLKTRESLLELAGKGTGDLREKTEALRVFEAQPIDDGSGTTYLLRDAYEPEDYRLATEGFYSTLTQASKDDLRTEASISRFFQRTFGAK